MHDSHPEKSLESLARALPEMARTLGFCAVGISAPTVAPEQKNALRQWLTQGCHGAMDYMEGHAALRCAPETLVTNVQSVISLALPYGHPTDGPISRYAQGRDYHKVMRRRLKALAERLRSEIGDFHYRVFSDSAPVLEVSFARNAGLGWRGKNTLLLTREGSGFFLGEIFTDLRLPVTTPQVLENHCGRCQKCLTQCPTAAFIGPYELDARRCISYLTIEHPGPIPEDLRTNIGQRFYGCDVCQAVCPWNRFAREPGDAAFAPWPELAKPDLVALFAWDEATFLKRLEGSPIRRIGHERWLRNLAVALGNSPPSAHLRQALIARRNHPSPLVREHVLWALKAHA
ncbi:MAG: tRNA epoxyqueuosine(34) reductase QueG [Zoogloeaceae bacterium]|jgi:epoxyqueuosine reductase|nr:tRNA epoxyqueuosine(34) reductase QueG [Zoogloeaceae bacterium]